MYTCITSVCIYLFVLKTIYSSIFKNLEVKNLSDFMICQAAVNHRNVYEFSRFLDYDTEYTTGVTGGSAEDAHLFMESDHTSNVLKGPCLLLCIFPLDF